MFFKKIKGKKKKRKYIRQFDLKKKEKERENTDTLGFFNRHIILFNI